MMYSMFENRVVYEVYYSKEIDVMKDDRNFDELVDELEVFDGFDNYERAKGFVEGIISLNEDVKYACIMKVNAYACIMGDPYECSEDDRQIVYQVFIREDEEDYTPSLQA